MCTRMNDSRVGPTWQNNFLFVRAPWKTLVCSWFHLWVICVVGYVQAGMANRALSERVIHNCVSFSVYCASLDVAYIIESRRNARE